MSTHPLAWVLPPKKEEPAPQLRHLRVDPQWRCQKSGECCTKLEGITLTVEEAIALKLRAPEGIKLQFRPHPDGGNFLIMKAGPCPFFAFNTCTVYEHRPYNCRRFGCMRPNVEEEEFYPDGSNMDIRVDNDKDAAKLARWMQKRAQPWAAAHGWKPEP